MLHVHTEQETPARLPSKTILRTPDKVTASDACARTCVEIMFGQVEAPALARKLTWNLDEKMNHFKEKCNKAEVEAEVEKKIDDDLAKMLREFEDSDAEQAHFCSFDFSCVPSCNMHAC